MATASCAMPFVWRLVVLLIVGLAPSASLAEPLPRSVLYLDENDPGLAFAREISAAFRSTVTAGSAERIAVYADNLDLVRSSGPRYEEILKTCMSSEHFGQLAARFKRVSGSSGLKFSFDCPLIQAPSFFDCFSFDGFPPFEDGRSVSEVDAQPARASARGIDEQIFGRNEQMFGLKAGIPNGVKVTKSRNAGEP